MGRKGALRVLKDLLLRSTSSEFYSRVLSLYFRTLPGWIQWSVMNSVMFKVSTSGRKCGVVKMWEPGQCIGQTRSYSILIKSMKYHNGVKYLISLLPATHLLESCYGPGVVHGSVASSRDTNDNTETLISGPVSGLRDGDGGL